MRNHRDYRRNTALARASRRGVAMTEAAIILSVLLVILFEMLDLGLAIIQQNTLNEAVRLLARTAIVHGNLSRSTAWGAATMSGTMADSSDAANAIRSLSVAMDPSTVSMKLEWPDGDNVPGHRVRATLAYQHVPMIAFVLGGAPISLSATSTMRIAH